MEKVSKPEILTLQIALRDIDKINEITNHFDVYSKNDGVDEVVLDTACLDGDNELFATLCKILGVSTDGETSNAILSSTQITFTV